VNTRGFRTTDALVCLPAQPRTGSSTTVLADERSPQSPVWIDLTALDHAACTMLQEQYGLSPEVMTYFLLRYQSAKLIHAGPALFLMTFLATPSTRDLFTTRELKICVTPTLVVTLCGASGKAQADLRRTLPLPSFSEGKSGQLLWGLLAGVVGSYDALVKTVREQRCEPVSGEEQHQWRKRVTKLVHRLRDEQVLLSNVAREGRKVFTPEESLRFRQLEERVEVLARVVWNISREGEELEEGGCNAT
jgi:Mg2+ and Co2+ transporter CorA